MIFVTVGTQLPFPRLLRAMDAFAADHSEEVVAQTGPDAEKLTHLQVYKHLSPAEFSEHFAQARVIVGHAGIGTILTAKSETKPLVILPRRHAFGEHRNDHQLATARYAEKIEGVYVAWQADDLAALLTQPDLKPAGDTPGPTYATLIGRLKEFIDT